MPEVTDEAEIAIDFSDALDIAKLAFDEVKKINKNESLNEEYVIKRLAEAIKGYKVLGEVTLEFDMNDYAPD